MLSERKKNQEKWRTVSFNKKNTGRGILQGKDRTPVGHHVRKNESGKGGTTTCVSMLCFPDTLLKSVRGETFCGKSIPHGAPAKNSVRTQEATGAQGRCALHSFWCEECPEPHVCVATLSLLLGFEVAQALVCVFFLCSHMLHTARAAQIWIPHARVVGPATPQ